MAGFSSETARAAQARAVEARRAAVQPPLAESLAELRDEAAALGGDGTADTAPAESRKGRKRGPYKRRTTAAVEREREAERERRESRERAATERTQRIELLAVGFTTTGRVVFNGMLQLQPEFGESQGKALAEAWEPLMGVADSPWVTALGTTALVLAPWLLQLAQRELNKPPGREVGNVPAPDAAA